MGTNTTRRGKKVATTKRMGERTATSTTMGWPTEGQPQVEERPVDLPIGLERSTKQIPRRGKAPSGPFVKHESKTLPSKKYKKSITPTTE